MRRTIIGLCTFVVFWVAEWMVLDSAQPWGAYIPAAFAISCYLLQVHRRTEIFIAFIACGSLGASLGLGVSKWIAIGWIAVGLFCLLFLHKLFTNRSFFGVSANSALAFLALRAIELPFAINSGGALLGTWLLQIAVQLTLIPLLILGCYAASKSVQKRYRFSSV